MLTDLMSPIGRNLVLISSKVKTATGTLTLDSPSIYNSFQVANRKCSHCDRRLLHDRLLYNDRV